VRPLKSLCSLVRASGGAWLFGLALAALGCSKDDAPDAPPPVCVPSDWARCDADAQRVEATQPELAASFYTKACAGGFVRACVHQGMVEERADKPLEAQKTYDAACAKGDLLGCAHLGMLHEHGKDWRITIDYAKAIAQYKRACEGGEGYGCVLLAEMREHSHGMAPNDLKETELYIKGCEKKNSLSCWRLSQRYRTARGARKNEAKANELQARACAGGCAEACGKGAPE
jgi:TPR repeat protein